MIRPPHMGKKQARYDHRDFLMAKYVDMNKFPPLPSQFGHEGKVAQWGMLGNDQVGDCTIAGAEHETMLLTALSTLGQAQFNDACAISDYSTATGYDPAQPNTDQGADMHDIMKFRRQTGVIDIKGNRHKIAGYVWLEPGNVQHLLMATYLFGVVGVGIQFPDSAMDQFNSSQPWTPVGGAQIQGGHYIPCVACRSNPLIVTWGKLHPMTPSFYEKYNDESIALISTEFLHGQTSPEGFSASDLITDLGLLAK